MPNLFLASSIAKSIDDKADYIKNKAFNEQYYKNLIVSYLKQYKKSKKKDIRGLLWDKFPDVLSDKQKEYKIGNLLASLKAENIVVKESENRQHSYGVLK